MLKNLIVEKLDMFNFHPIVFYLIVRKLEVFNFHPIFFLLLSLISPSRMRFEYVFLKKHTSKLEIL